jgi:hypothetical protein
MLYPDKDTYSMATLKPTSISLPEDLEAQVKAEATERGVFVSTIIRWALAERYKSSSIKPVSVQGADKPVKRAAQPA